MSYSARIMNVQVADKVRAELDGAPKGFYLLGHRDARHAAAEIAAEADARLEVAQRMADALNDLRSMINEHNADQISEGTLVAWFKLSFSSDKAGAALAEWEKQP